MYFELGILKVTVRIPRTRGAICERILGCGDFGDLVHRNPRQRTRRIGEPKARAGHVRVRANADNCSAVTRNQSSVADTGIPQVR